MQTGSKNISNDTLYPNFVHRKFDGGGGEISFDVTKQRLEFLKRENTANTAAAITVVGGLCAALSTVAVPALYANWRAPNLVEPSVLLYGLVGILSGCWSAVADKYTRDMEKYERERAVLVSSSPYKWSTMIGYGLGAGCLAYTAHWLKWCYTTRQDNKRHFPGCDFQDIQDDRTHYKVTYRYPVNKRS